MRLLIPEYAKKAAKEALELRARLPRSKQFGLSKEQAASYNPGMKSGVERAKEILRLKYMSFKKVQEVARFYARFKGREGFKAENSLKLWGGRGFGRMAVAHVKKHKKR